MDKKSLTHSLLVPCYNAEKHVESFLENFSKLSNPFDEMIFYDDASTDKTAILIKSKGYRLIRGETNMGPGYARNRLADAANGDYIHFHDIDDEIAPQFITRVNEKLKNGKPDVILGNADWIDSASRQLLIAWKYNEAELKNDPIAYFITHPLGIINTVYKRDVFLNVHGFDEQLHCWEDADLHVRLAISRNTFSVIDTVLAYSIRHHTGISENQGWCWKCRLKYLKNYRQQLGGTYGTILGIEFEKTAFALLGQNEIKAALKAFRDSRKCGYNAPTVNNPVFKFLKKISPFAAFLFKGLIIKSGYNPFID